MTANVDHGLGGDATAGLDAPTEDFAAFYAREFASVVGLARVLTGSATAAEDVAQEAFGRRIDAG